MTSPGRLFSRSILPLAVLVCTPAPAFAEDTIAVIVGGKAQGAGADVRTHALDVAFSDAVNKVVRELLSSDVRERFKASLRDKVIRRARLYVAKYKVLDERSIEGELRLQVEVTVDRDKLRAAFAELRIGEAPAPTATGTRPRVVVLLKATAGQDTVTTFGSTGGDGGVAARAVFDELRAQGFDVIDAAGKPAPLGGDGDEGLPLADDAALELARGLGAGGAFVIGVGAAGEGRIRGTRLSGAAATASVRVLDVRSRKPVARAAGKGAGWGGDDRTALAAASGEAVERAMRSVVASVVRQWPAATRTASDKLEIRIRGAATWAAISAIIDKLAATKGVRGIHPRRVDRGKVDLALDSGLSAGDVAAQIKRARLTRGSVATMVKDGAVLVKISGDSSASGTAR